jgi:hypothetical protein
VFFAWNDCKSYTLLLGMLGVVGCMDEPRPLPEQITADVPALHRLTESQINDTLRDLFLDSELNPVSLPLETAVDGFSNNALTRDATPYLVESLQRDLNTVLQAEVADGGAWMLCAPSGGADPVLCGHENLVQTQQRAWRRTTTADEQAWIIELFDGYYSELGFEGAMRLSLLVLLQSPDFLYLIEQGDPEQEVDGVRPLTDFEVASRLSYFLWDTMPDHELFAAASAGELQSAEQVRAQAQRMLQDDRSQAASLRFYKQWLGYQDIQDIQPGSDFFREDLDDEAMGAEIATLKLSYMAEFELFVQHAAWERGSLDALLTSRQGFVSEQTAPLYGLDFHGLDASGHQITFQTSELEATTVVLKAAELPAEQRAGILTQGGFLAANSHATQPSPVLRGAFVLERLMCAEMEGRPDNAPSLDQAALDAWTTNRERYSEHTADPACASCHTAINGAGFPFENYDAVGAWRDTDNGAAIDSSGELVGTDVDGAVPDAVALVETLAASRQVYDCAVTQIYRYGVHRSETELDDDAILELQQSFWATGGSLPDLLVDLTSSQAFRTRRMEGAN